VPELIRHRVPAVGMLIIVLAVCAWGLWLSSQLIVADFASMGARYRIDRWIGGAAKWTVPEWVEARAALDEAIATTPDNPMLHDYLGSLYALRGIQAWRSEVLRKSLFAEAARHQKISLKYRPQNGPTWANLALSLHALGEPQPVVADALLQALRQGRNEFQVRRVLSDLTLATWNSAPIELKTWLKERYRKGSENERRLITEYAKNRGVAVTELAS